MQRLWRRYGPTAVVVLALVIAIGGGLAWWRQHEAGRAAEAGALYQQALDRARAGKLDEALTGFEALKSAPSGYAALARLQTASVLERDGKRDDAVAAYRAVAADEAVDPLLRDAAAIGAASIMVDDAPLAELTSVLARIGSTGNPWRPLADELIALGQLRAGDVETARAGLQKIADDASAPAGLRARASELLAAIPVANGAPDAEKRASTPKTGG